MRIVDANRNMVKTKYIKKCLKIKKITNPSTIKKTRKYNYFFVKRILRVEVSIIAYL